MQCNIDQRGRRVRMIGGVLNLLAAAVVAVLVLLQVAPTWLGVVAAVLLALGAFQVFEARKGWCVARAMGFKTPM